ncbi:MAG: hypothetical protein ACYTF5_21815, partial [Planctomycetota bacterium]
EQTAHAATRNNLQIELENRSAKLRDATRQLSSTKSLLDNVNTKLDSAKKSNQELDRRLPKMESDYAVVAREMGAMATEIKVAHQSADQAMSRAIAAEKEKDRATTAETKALAKIDELNFTIGNKDTEIAKLNGANKSLDQTQREQKVLLDLVRIKAPGIFATVQPSVSGRVEFVGKTGKLITIAVNAGGEFLKAGYRFAIYNRTDGYLGEAVVTEWDGSKYAFATVNVAAEGARKPQVGDMASTNLSGNDAAKKEGN